MDLMQQTAEAPGVVAFDLPCVGCGYNLRTQPLSARCPECAASVDAAVHADAVRRADLGALRMRGLPWLIAMRRGVRVALFAWTVNAAAATAAYLDFDSLTNRAYNSGWQLVLPAAAYVIAALASWRLVDPGGRRGRRIASRTLVAVSSSWIGLFFLNDNWARAYLIGPARASLLHSELWTTLPTIGAVVSLAMLVTIVLTLFKLIRIAVLARRFGLCVVLSLYGLGFALLSLVLHASLLNDRYISSGEAIELAPSTLGLTPVAGLVTHEAIRAILVPRYRALRADEVFGYGLIGLMLVLTIAALFAWVGIARALSRAIDLERSAQLARAPLEVRN